MFFKVLIVLATGFLIFTGVNVAEKAYHLTKMREVRGELPKFGALNDKHPAYEAIIQLHDPKYGFYCTGFVIDANYAVTAAHCLVDKNDALADRDVVIFDSQSKNTYVVAHPAAIDKYQDVGILQGNFKNFARYDVDWIGSTLHVGMQVKACGYPAGQKALYCSMLTVLGNQGFEFKSYGLPIYKGQSGGPVFDVQTGKVVGVNSAVAEEGIVLGPLVGALQNWGID